MKVPLQAPFADSLVSGITCAIKKIMDCPVHEMHEEYKVFWTKYGLIFIKNETSPIYLVHNNATIFRLTTGLLRPVLHILATSSTLPEDWKVSLIELSHGITLRSITPTEHLPKMKKLAEYATKIFKQVKLNPSEDSWLIC